MKLTNEQMDDVHNTCKKVFEGSLTIPEANDYLKVYGVEKAAFAEDGKASLYFFNKEIIRFNNLKNSVSNRKEEKNNKSIVR